MSGHDESFAHISVHIGPDWQTLCHTYDQGTPILVVDAGRSAVSLSIKDRKADKAAVEFARALARDAQVFAAEVERLHAEFAPPDTASDQAA